MPTTWNTGSLDPTVVQGFITGASPGDVVQMPAGTVSWPGNAITISNGITLRGAGSANTIIDMSGTFAQYTVTITKHATHVTRIESMQITSPNGTHDGDYQGAPFSLLGNWLGAEPIVFQFCHFEMVGGNMLYSRVAGGVIIADSTCNGTWNTFLLSIKADYGDSLDSWTTADTFGDRDTTGKKNNYIERVQIRGCSNGYVDLDDNDRSVHRNNIYTNCGGINSHGFDTSSYGQRHWEIYDNQFLYEFSGNDHGTFIYPFYGGSYTHNIIDYIWIRGGTGIIANNYFQYANTQDYGIKHYIRFSIRGIQDVYNNCYGPGGCGIITYPCPRQLGQSHNGSIATTDPINIWGNSGSFLLGEGDWYNPCNTNMYGDFFQGGRDYILSGGDGTGSTAKAGYAKYTYPHPLTVTTDTALRGRSTPQLFI